MTTEASSASSSSPSSSPSPVHSPKSPPDEPPLPPINTGQTAKRTPLQRPPSYAKNRISTYSTTSKLSEKGSRPMSHAFPAFHSSLPYALVRDFAYPVSHPCHYGPPPASSEPPSGSSTPASERPRRLSDPASRGWDSAGPWGGDGFFSTQQLPSVAYGDGPPYSEDEDLHSPVVKSARHKKHKSAFPEMGRRSAKSLPGDNQRSFLTGVDEDGSNTYYLGDEDESANGSGGDFIAYPSEGRQSTLTPNRYGQRDSHFATGLPNRSRLQNDTEDSEEESLGVPEQNFSRYSRDYQFTIASPDEEMHGKAVALFDFARENENELPLTEGQVIWVSYRHGQGWLVAEDPKTRDAGLVPEEYVRLLRDIEGGLGSLGNEPPPEDSDEDSPDGPLEEQATSPLKNDASQASPSQNGGSVAEKNPAVVSSFSTSSKDLDPYPHRLLGAQAGQLPPQVVHYGSQTNTPTVRSPASGVHGPRGFEEIKGLDNSQTVEEAKKEEDHLSI